MAWKYAASIETPHGKAMGRSLPISSKHAMEISRHLRGKSLKRAKAILNALLSKKEAVPFKTFKRDVGHKPGIAAGRYPVKAGASVLEVLESAESNANAKGLSVQDLYVAHIVAQRGNRSWRGGRKGRVKNKSTHVEIMLVEGAKKTKKKVSKKTTEKVAKKEAPKAEVKKETPKAESKSQPEVKKESKSEEPVQQKAEQKEAKTETPAPKAEEKPAPAEKKEEQKAPEASQ